MRSADHARIYNNNVLLTLNECTLSRNFCDFSVSVGGGVFNANGTLTLNPCTLGGKVASLADSVSNVNGALNLFNSIVDANSIQGAIHG